VNAFSQKVIKHKIKSGESIYGLALKYDLTEKEMYALNPKTKGAILQLGQVVNIPNKKYKEKPKPSKKDKKELVADKKETKEVPADTKNLTEKRNLLSNIWWHQKRRFIVFLKIWYYYGNAM